MQCLPYRIRRVWAVLFLTTITLCLSLAHSTLTIGHKGILEKATAQSTALTQPVQQGIELYQAGNIQGAIKSWETYISSQGGRIMSISKVYYQ